MTLIYRSLPHLQSWRDTHLAGLTAIPLRLIVGYGFMAHGYAKLVKGPDHFVGIVNSLGLPGAHFFAWATILVELICGFAVFVGAFVAFGSIGTTCWLR